jgi:hypothetical protein
MELIIVLARAAEWTLKHPSGFTQYIWQRLRVLLQSPVFPNLGPEALLTHIRDGIDVFPVR